MKKVLKDKSGVAMVMVISLIAIMSLLGTALYMFSVQSVNTYKFGLDRNKAEYLARAGIEAAAYRYQNTVIRSSSDEKLKLFIEKGNTEAIGSNRVYLDNSGNYFTANEPSGPPTENYIGYFEVDITNETRTVFIESIGANNEIAVKVIRSKGYVNGKVAAKSAYILPATEAYNSGWYTSDGINLEYPEYDKIIPAGADNKFETRLKNGIASTFRKDVSAFKRSYSYVIKIKFFGREFIYEPFKNNGGAPNINADTNSYVGYGNTILQAPKIPGKTGQDALGPLKFKAGDRDNICSFISMQNLFVNANVDLKPDPGNFNFMAFVANQIVINGDINLYVYYMSPTLSEGLGNKLIKNFYFSTVYLQTPSSNTSTITDPAKSGCGECGKVYFNGNVYINIKYPNEGEKRYKVFSSGDVYYFDKNFYKNESEKKNGSPVGIDILKYFLDTSIEKNGLSTQTLQRFELIRQVYYQNTSSKDSTNVEFSNNYTSVAGGTTSSNGNKQVSMRKVDYKKNSADKIYDTIPPAAVDSAGIIWE